MSTTLTKKQTNLVCQQKVKLTEFRYAMIAWLSWSWPKKKHILFTLSHNDSNILHFCVTQNDRKHEIDYTTLISGQA